LHIHLLFRPAALAAAVCFTAGCGAIRTSAIKSVANTLSEGGTTFTSHNDPELIEGALPFALTLYESLLDSIPTHEPLLTATCAAYTQYAFGFVQVHAEETRFDDLIDAQVPARLADWTRANVESKWVFLLGLNAFLIIVGGMMDIFSSIIVVVPLIVPIARHFQVDPIHLGIIFIANSELGYLTPPVGENLFVASYRFNKPILHIARAMLPMYVILLIGVLLITYVTYVPWLTLGFLR
jgi:hypothetical protein